MLNIVRNKIDNSISKLILSLSDVVFEIELRGSLTIVNGDSSTGKTYFINSLKQYYASYPSVLKEKFDIEEIIFLDCHKIKNNSSILKGTKNCLVLVDNADYLLSIDKDLLEYISYDRENQYLVMSRVGVSFPVSGNHYCEFIVDGQRIYTDYFYDIDGWM